MIKTGRTNHTDAAIRLFTTGGTIDNLDYERIKDAPRVKKSRIPALVRGRLRVTHPVSIEHLMAKDSRFITEADMELIAKKCLGCPEERIVITHGTFTMERTASYLQKKKIPKTIVLTGSHTPLEQPGDAEFNIGTAISAAQIKPKGVWVVLQGRIFGAGHVTKNLGTGFFEQRN